MIKRREIRAASVFVILQQAANLGIRLGGSLLLTRLLSPEAFGLVSVGYIIIAGLGLLTDLGIGQSITINPRGLRPDFLNTAWTLNIIRGLVIALGHVFCAVAVFTIGSLGALPHGTIYANPELPWVAGAFGMAALISGFESTKIFEARRHLIMGPLTLLEISSQSIALFVMLGVAWVHPSAWALVFGAITAALVKTLGSHLLPGLANQLRWDSTSARELISFGKWMLLSSALVFAVQQSDKLLLGGLLAPAQLGAYAIAGTLLSVPQGIFLTLVSTIVLPSISSAMRAGEPFARSLYKSLQLKADLFLFTTAGLGFAGSEAVVRVLYDERYRPAGGYLAILSLGLIGLRYAIVEQCFLASGRAHYFALWNGLRTAVIFAGLPLGYMTLGVQGAIWAVVASCFAGWPLALKYKWEKNLFTWGELVGPLAFCVGLLGGWGFSSVISWLGLAHR